MIGFALAFPPDLPQLNKKPTAAYLSPPRNLLQERLREANKGRSPSVHRYIPRGQTSPFCAGSPLALPGLKPDLKSPSAPSKTLRREVARTMSPKDAVLEYDEDDSTEISVSSPGSPIYDPV